MHHLQLLALRQVFKPHDLAHLMLSGACLDDLSASLDNSIWKKAALQQKALKTLGIELLPIVKMPRVLQQLPPLAPMLFVRGSIKPLFQTAIGIVGSRKASPDAEAWAFEQAAMRAHDHVIISGGARGIDTAAHQGALTTHGKTLVFLGVPIDRVYPASNRKLFEKIIAAGGALISEHPPLSTTFQSDLAMRNRFIAGMSRYVMIAEAAEDSGSLVTAKWAQRYGVDVFVSPQPIGKQRSGIEKLVESNKAKYIY